MAALVSGAHFDIVVDARILSLPSRCRLAPTSINVV